MRGLMKPGVLPKVNRSHHRPDSRKKLSRPLDWIALTEHTDLMVFLPNLQASEHGVLADLKGREWFGGYKKGGAAAGRTVFGLISNFSQMTLLDLLFEPCSPGAVAFAFSREKIVNSAQRHNEPGNSPPLSGSNGPRYPKVTTSTEK